METLRSRTSLGQEIGENKDRREQETLFLRGLPTSQGF